MWLWQAAIDATASDEEVVGCAVWGIGQMSVHRFGVFFPGEVEALGQFTISEVGLRPHGSLRSGILALEHADAPDLGPDTSDLLVEAFVDLKLERGVVDDHIVSIHDQVAGELLDAGAYTQIVRDSLSPDHTSLCTPPHCLNPSADQRRGGLCGPCAKEHGADFADFLDG